VEQQFGDVGGGGNVLGDEREDARKSWGKLEERRTEEERWKSISLSSAMGGLRLG
jgi:hypothetical protein